ncbi:FGGY family carbohydrate kinase, partial [Actinotalea sp. JY-7885]|uniref:FGGY family carbohydrate kinase n=1 Tax=Actinotalea sp. JY-7885 TaxID=2758576 RepID=UPI00165DF5DC
MDTILTIDQGTTSTKALLVDAASGAVLGRGTAPVAIAYPRPGWVEQDAEDLWGSVQVAARRCLAAAARPVTALAISNQRESVVAWRASSGDPLGPVLGWQDSRTAAWCAKVTATERVWARTGLPLDAMYSAPKMRWLLQYARDLGVPAGDVRVGTVDSWLVHRLTGEHLVEAGNASRTLLLDLDRLEWDEEMLALFGLPDVVLPRVQASSGGFGTVRGGALGLDGVPVLAVLADSHAALYHHGQAGPGTAKATYGTGSSVMLPTDGRVRGTRGATSTLAWLDGAPQYASEGNILTSGAALDWVARLLGTPPDVPGGQALTELAATEPDSGGVVVVPAFTGLGAPHWDRDAVGTLTGVTGGTTRGHVARAALEAVAHQVCDVVEAVLRDGSADPGAIVADGGATASPLLMQTQADLLGRPVVVSAAPEASALGAADLAARVLT